MTGDPASGADGPASLLAAPSAWAGPSSDPRDAQFGDVVERATLGTADECDVVLVGEPYDGAVIGRPGAAEGPAAVRESLAAAKTHHADAGPVGQSERIGDLGDVRPSGVDDDRPPDADGDADHPVSAVHERVESVTRAVHDADAVPVFLGGDNSLTVPNVSPLLDRGSVGVLSFDAHLDCRAVDPETGPTSGTPYRQLNDAGLDALAVVGARHFETSTAYHDYLREQGGHVVPPAAVARNPADALDDAVASLGDVDAVYVSLDVDVLDAAAAPGVSAPTPGGLTTRELFGLLSHVGAHGRVAGFEVVECAPPLDRDGRTVDAAARAVAHFLAGRAARVAGRRDRVVSGDV